MAVTRAEPPSRGAAPSDTSVLVQLLLTRRPMTAMMINDALPSRIRLGQLNAVLGDLKRLGIIKRSRHRIGAHGKGQHWYSLVKSTPETP